MLFRSSLLDALDRARAGRASSLRCPAHEDRNPSLSIRPAGLDGWLKVHCFRGCRREDVLQSVGLTLSALGPDRLQPLPRIASKARPHAPPMPEAKRARWPAFEPPTDADLRRLAVLRNLAVDGLRLAVARGILRTVPDFRGHRAWIVTDAARHAAQARRLDGLPWPTRDGGTVKALSLPGSRAGWPVGLAAVRPEHGAILLCEGGPDLLAAHVALWAEGREGDAAAVGMMGGQATIEPEAIQAFTEIGRAHV